MRWLIPRFLYVCWMLGKLAVGVWIGDPILRWLGKTTLDGPSRVKHLLEDIGGAFVKFGQMLALQADFVPPHYADALFDLMDRVKPFSYEQVRATIQAELGKTPEQLFETIDPVPLATASIGQVHVATIYGKKVAVKVQRPVAQAEIMGDIGIMSTAVKAINFLRIRQLRWMVEPLKEFISWSVEELDYRNEARHSETIRQRAHGLPNIVVPKVIWQLTTPRILVAEFLEGLSLTDYLRATEESNRDVLEEIDQLGFEREKFSNHLIENFVGCAFKHGVFHADMHPANLMILADNKVGYIDFGITGKLSLNTRKALVSLTLAYSRGLLDEMIGHFIDVSAFGDNPDEPRFRNGIYEAANAWYTRSGGATKLKTSVSKVMLDMLVLSKDTDIWPQQDVIKYIRSAITLDGLIKRIAPEFRVGESLEEVCKSYLRWGARGELLSYEHWLQFWTQSALVTMTTPEKLEQISTRLLESATRQGPKTQGQSTTEARGELWLGGLVLGLSLLYTWGHEKLTLDTVAAAAMVGLIVLGTFLLLVRAVSTR